MLKLEGMTQITNKTELNTFYENNIAGNVAYAIVEYGNTFPYSICINKIPAIDGGVRFIESPNILRVYDFSDEKITKELLSKIISDMEYGANGAERALNAVKQFIETGIIYEIESPQVPQFLPEQFSIKLISEQECMEWLQLYRR